MNNVNAITYIAWYANTYGRDTGIEDAIKCELCDNYKLYEKQDKRYKEEHITTCFMCQVKDKKVEGCGHCLEDFQPRQVGEPIGNYEEKSHSKKG